MKKLTLAIGTGLLALGLGFTVGGSNAEATHIVKPGDTLSKIANNYGVGLDKVVKDNPQIANINLIFVGQAINGVGPSTVASSTYTNQSYVAPKKNYVAPKATYVAPKVAQKAYVAPKKSYVAPKQNYTSNATGSEAEARNYISYKESTNNYNARSASGKYIGRWQLDRSYLNGDYSPANQDRVVEKYVKNRYGSWANAKKHHLSHNWY